MHHRGELQHRDAQTLFRAAPLRVTHSYVLAEFIALAQVRRLDRAAALAFVAELQHTPLVQVIWVDELLHRAGVELLQRQLDKTYSLCDAISFLIMHERGLVEALTTDRHFEQAGFRRLLAGG